ncbi:UDP-2,3-diacylglucosamine hydrolase [Sphingomonas oleivorans]|uniref:UDP-2,3-diacylglucosamine hydrolase n=1 Tax=Sphingomonas oleivorans TaxID=1735121 RepID=A0A2T5G017_9SPHN|nr:UDP-2,3-diacylglucosamine diphosphatase [Sphingomonas oleivorans]PTQ12303.1 UDP-2,3-diacylglucosamine hydrolase [Sphingomonas oleivorans]
MDAFARPTFLADRAANLMTDFPDRPPTMPERTGQRRRYRTIWISDIHLGTRGCNAAMLIDFLDSTDSETMYLVGDIIDGWKLRRSWYWPALHNDVVWRVLKRARRGTRIVYIPGNHDEMIRQFAGLTFGGIEVRDEVIHTTADGRKLLVLHGDRFDTVVMCARWLAFLGDAAYELLLKLNVVINAVRRRFDLPYWSLAKHAKHKVKNAVEFISRYEEAVAHEAVVQGVDGVVCGHIHTAEMRRFGDVAYYNDGDWVEGCTALVEHFDGRMEILHWADEMAARDKPTPLRKLAA